MYSVYGMRNSQVIAYIHDCPSRLQIQEHRKCPSFVKMNLTDTTAGLWGVLLNILIRFSIASPIEPIYLPTLKNVPPVGVRTMAFTDKTRLDDFAPTPQYREVVVSLFYPMDMERKNHKGKDRVRPTTNYLPNATATYFDELFTAAGAPSGAVKRIVTYSQTNGSFLTTSRPPLLVFSPGWGMTFHGYTAILQEVARKGFVVAAIDHPYDANLVEFPNGKIVRGVGESAERNWTAFLTVRLLDVSFVLNELSRPAPSHPFPLDTDHVVAFGHSMGGDTAVEVMLHDSRITGGLNFDGDFNGPLNFSDVTISRPVLLFRTKADSESINWSNETWEKLVGWKLELTVSDTTHYSFLDLPLLVDVLGIRAGFPSTGGPYPLGELEGLRGLDIMSSYVGAFAKFLFTGDDRGSLKSKVGKSFPEVEFVRKGGPQRDADIGSF